MRMRNQRGFTLMELMVVIVIVAILAAVAVPLYINYVKDAKRTEAKGAIAAIISAEQVWYQKNATYTADVSAETGLNLAEITEEVNRNWDFAVPSADANGFTVTAVGKAGADADGLAVQCVYTRAGGPVWSDVVDGGGGGAP